MRSYRWIFTLVPIFILFSGVALRAADDKGDETRALIQTVNPADVHNGDTVVATGVNLGKKFVLDLYITDGKDDVKVEVVSQTNTEITFKVPADIKGRYRLMIMTNAVVPQFIEQPCRIMIE